MLSTNEGERGTRLDAWLYIEEITHRTLNEYTAMLAIVRRASHSVTDETTEQVFETAEQALDEVATRLRAAAMSFLALRPPLDDHVRDLNRELEALCAALSRSFSPHRRITLTLTSEPVTVDAFRCWQLSLIIFELVTNAARHAFLLRRRGFINVMTSVRGGKIECAVVDDGICDDTAPSGRGTAIIDALINDLGGTISRHYAVTGSTILLSIPCDEDIFPPKVRRIAQPCSPPPGSGPSDIGSIE